MHARDLPVFVRSMTRALLDSHDVASLLEGEEISSVGRMQALLPLVGATDEGRGLLARRPLLTSKTVDVEWLRALAPGTVGHAWMQHLETNGLDLDGLATPVVRGDSVAQNWLLQRVRQTHDLWHTTLGLTTQPYHEVLVHAFQWSQLRMPYSGLVVFFGAWKHFVGEARWTALRYQLPAAFAAGRRAGPLLSIAWENRWEQPLDDLRREFRVTPASAW